ncbi:MAG: diguanylate cyclase [Alicyclobacillaceae bacterium]|nr:diguanylate cyclase [Alicyclobacillaceae bacterium]
MLKHWRRWSTAVYAGTLWIGLGFWTATHRPAPTVDDWVVMYTLAGLLLLVRKFSIPITERDRLYFDTVYLVGFSLAYQDRLQVIVWGGLIYAVVSAFQAKRRPAAQLTAGTAFTYCAFVSAVVTQNCFAAQPLFSITQVLPIVLYGAVYFTLNVVLVTAYFVLDMGIKGLQEFRRVFSVQFVMVYAIEILIGLLLALVIHEAGLAGAILLTGLILLVSYSYRDYFKLAQHFKQLAIRDELTGLYNHRWIQSWIDSRIEASQPFSLLMVDIDRFKRYNEIFGHVQGDEALKLMANLLRETCLPGEEVARYSGEEFAIVLPGADVKQAEARAESLRKAVEQASFPGVHKLPGQRLTISVGVASYPDMADNKRDLLMMVDDALYKGKFTGRNKVSIYTSVLDELKRELATDEEREIIQTIKVFLAILNSKDRYTYAHTERDVRYAEALGRRLGLSESALRNLRFGAFLHDIGKVEIPLEVLTKRGPLTRDEWNIMKSHVEIGVRIVEQIPSLAPCLPIIRHHHERYDGTGYPDRLAGTEIPLEARILTIADSFDAMTTSRPYQQKRTLEEAFAELRSCAGKQFDPDLVEPFIEVVGEIGLLSEEAEQDPA